jgi:hypothetical protein
MCILECAVVTKIKGIKQNTKYYICAVLINPFISKTGEEHKTLNQHRI